MTRKKVVAVLESMWDWRSMTSGAGYTRAPRFFTINPHNHSGRRLYSLVGTGPRLLCTNACPQLVRSAREHGTPDPVWLEGNLRRLMPVDLVLVCGRIAQDTYDKTGCNFTDFAVLRIPHPAARMWSHALIAKTKRDIETALN